MNLSKLLITGATGFVGTNLVKYLYKEANHSIYSLVRNRSKAEELLNKESTSFIEADEISGLTGYESYIHLAGKAHDTDYSTNREEFFKVNLSLTQKVSRNFLDDPASKQFIFVSSVAAVTSKAEEPLTERIDPVPNGFYGESKLAAEEYIRENIPTDKEVYILRPPMIHGPGNKGNLNLLYKLVSKGIPWPLGRFDNSRSFLSIRNLCYVIGEILDGNLEPGIYNVADSTPLSTNRLVELIAQSAGRKPRILNTPKPLIRAIAKAGNLLPLPLNEERLQKLTEDYLVSNKKLVTALGKDLPVSAEEGMKATLEAL